MKDLQELETEIARSLGAIVLEALQIVISAGLAFLVGAAVGRRLQVR